MRRGICHRCRKRKATAHWTMRPCAVNRVVKVALCGKCDLVLNSIAVLFARLPQARTIIARYAQREGLI